MKKTLLLLSLGLIAGYALSYLQTPKTTSQTSPIVESQTETKTQKADNIKSEDEFPTLNLPLEYFENNRESPSVNGEYDVLPDASAYHSYPSTTISLNPDLYSSVPTPLPPIKSDIEIHIKDPELDFMGSSKDWAIQKYGDLARRFVGEAGVAWLIDSVEKVDMDQDGEKETLLSLSLTGANVGAQRNVIIKGDKIIFSTDQDTFSTLTPAKNGNGFFLEWADNFKKREGYITTRFIFDGKIFVPVYEQKTRYIRVPDTPSQ